MKVHEYELEHAQMTPACLPGQSDTRPTLCSMSLPGAADVNPPEGETFHDQCNEGILSFRLSSPGSGRPRWARALLAADHQRRPHLVFANVQGTMRLVGKAG